MGTKLDSGKPEYGGQLSPRRRFNDPVGAVDLTGLCPVNGGANVADCTAEDFGANPFFLSPFALAIGDALNSPVGRAVSSVLEGIGDGSSFGLTGQLRQALGVDCNVEKNGYYVGGAIFGAAATTYISGASSVAADAAETGSSNVGSAIAGRDLACQLASEQQMGEAGRTLAGAGAGAGTSTKLRQAERLTSDYGGSVAGWTKMGSSSYRGADGFQFETHWYEDALTGTRVEYKTKFRWMP